MAVTPSDVPQIEGPLFGMASICEKILRDLPEWFGIEASLIEYVDLSNEMPMFVARLEGDAVGFVCVKQHFVESAELYVLGVMKDFHRRGIGRRLLETTEEYLAGQGIRFVQVKTISANSDDAGYAKTRRFYEAMGYVALEEFPELWDPHNPCLQMIKHLSRR